MACDCILEEYEYFKLILMASSRCVIEEEINSVSPFMYQTCKSLGVTCILLCAIFNQMLLPSSWNEPRVRSHSGRRLNK